MNACVWPMSANRRRDPRGGRSKSIVSTAAIWFSLLLMSGGTANAQTNGTWTDLSTGGLWSDPSNWFSNFVPDGVGATADFSTLNLIQDTLVYLDSSRTVGTLIFGDMNSSHNWSLANNIGMGGFVLTLDAGSGNPPTINVKNQTTTIGAILAGNHGLNKDGAGTLLLVGVNTYSGGTTINAGTVIAGNFHGSATGSGDITIGPGATLAIGDGTARGDIAAANITDNGNLIYNRPDGTAYGFQVAGSGVVTMNGTGRLTLTGVNTYTGGTIINDGILVAGNVAPGSATGSGDITIGPTATLSIGDGTARGDIAAAHITDNGNFIYNRPDGTVYGFQVSGSGTLTKYAGGTLVLTGDNTYTGGTISYGGVLQIGNGGSTGSVSSAGGIANAGSLIFDRGDNYSYFGVISGSGSLTKIGPGTLTLSGTNTFTGGLAVQEGTLQIPAVNDAGTNGPLGNNISVTLGAPFQNGTLEYTGGTATSSMPFTLGGMSGGVGTGAGTVRVDNAATNLTLSGTITALGALGKEGPGTLTLSGTVTAQNYFAVTDGILAVTGTINNIGQTGQPGQVYLYGDIGTNGAATVSGAWHVSQEIIFQGGALNVVAGGAVTDLNARIGVGAIGTATVSGANARWDNSGVVYLGELGGQGTLNINSGGLVTDATGGIGLGTSTTGLVHVSAGSWTNTADLDVAIYGNGTLNIDSGGVVSNVNGLVAYNAGSTGTVTVSGAGSQWNSSAILAIGGNLGTAGGAGSVTISNGGAINVGGTIGIWNSGTLTINDGGSVTTVSLNNLGALHFNGGSLTINGGAFTQSPPEFLIGQGGGSATLNLINGATASDARGVLGEGGIATANVSGGSHWINSDIFYVGRNGIGSQGFLNVTSGGSVSSLHGVIGYSGPGTVSVSGNGSQWTMTGGLIVGQSTGTLNIDSQGIVSDVDGSVGIFTGSTGIVNVSGGGQWNNSGYAYLGGEDLDAGSRGGTATVNVTAGGIVRANRAVLASRPNSTVTVTVSGANSQWNNSYEMDVGYLSNATLNVNSSGKVTDQNGVVGYYSTGTATVSGGGSIWTNSNIFFVAYGSPSAIGTLNVDSAGAVSVSGDGIIGDNGASGTVNVSAGAHFSAGDLFLGGDRNTNTAGTGILNISSGGVVTVNSGNVAQNAGTHGTVTIDGVGSTFTSSSYTVIGQSGNGTATIQNGGLLSTGGNFAIAGSPGSISVVTVTGSGLQGGMPISSQINCGGSLQVGYLGNGTLNVNSGGSVSSGVVNIVGYNTNSTGTVNISGSGSQWTMVQSLYVGYSGNGTVSVNSGGAMSSFYADVGGQVAGAVGSVTVSGSGSQWTNSSQLDIGIVGNGTLSINSGGVVNDATCHVGYFPGSTGTVTIDGAGSMWTNTGRLYIGGSDGTTAAGQGTVIVQNGGSLLVPNDVLMIGSVNGGGGVLTVTGATSQVVAGDGLYVGRGNGTLNVQNGATMAVTLGGVPVGDQPGSIGIANVDTGAHWSNASILAIGSYGNGMMNVNSGGVVSDVDGRVAYFGGSTGAVTVGGAGSQWNNSAGLAIGGSLLEPGTTGPGGTGLVTVSPGGAINVGGLTKLWNAGTLTINGGSVTTNSLDRTVGTLNLNDGTLTVSGGQYLHPAGTNLTIDGNSAAASPLFQLTNGATTSGIGSLIVGNLQRGNLSIKSGATVNSVTAGINPGSVATISGAGSSWFVGPAGNGTEGELDLAGALNVQAGGHFTNVRAFLSGGINLPAIATVSGSGSNWSSTSFVSIGQYGNAVMTVQNGGSLNTPGTSANVVVGFGQNGNGTLYVLNGGTVSDTNGYIANSGGATGIVNINGGGSTWTNSGAIFFGQSSGGSNTLNINGGLVQAGGFDASAAPTNLVTINLNGGVLRTPGWIAGASSSPTTKLNFNGGTLKASASSDDFLTPRTSQVAVYSAGATVDTDGNDIVVAQPIAGGTLSGVASATTVDSTVFTSPPALAFSGSTPATGYTTLDSSGHIASIVITNPGRYNFGFTPVATVAGTLVQPSVNMASNSGGGLTKIGAGSLTITGSTSVSGAVNVNVGTLAFDGGANTLSAPIANVNAGTQLILISGSLAGDVNDQGEFDYDGGSLGGRLTIGSAGTIKFYATPFIAGNGVLNQGSISIPGSQTVTLNGLGLDNEGSLTVNGGNSILNLNGPSNVNAAGGTLTINGGATVNISQTLANNGTMNLAAATSLASGGTIATSGASGLLTGQGIVQSAVTVSGGGAVQAPSTGTLRVNGSTTVNSGGQLKSAPGALWLAGAATVNSGGAIAVGDAQLITASGGLTLAGGSATFAVPGSPAGNMTNAPLVNVSGGGSSSLAVSGSNSILIAFTGNPNTQVGSTISYDLLNYTGTDLLPVATGATLTFPGGGTMTANAPPTGWSLVDVPGTLGNPNQIRLLVTVPGSEQWTGATNANWDTTTTNWATTSPLVATQYADGSNITFADTNPLTNATVTNSNVTIVPAQVNPASIAFTNNTVNYTFSGGAIGGASSGITLSGTGSVTLNGNNTFVGAVALNGGQLVLGAANALGNASAVSVAPGAALVLNSAPGNSMVFASRANGSGSIGLTLAGAGLAASPNGALISVAGNNSYTGAITLTGPTTINSASNAAGDGLTLAGAVGGSGSMTKIGVGKLTLAGSNTFGGPLNINGGSLVQMGNITSADVHDQSSYTYNSGAFGGRLFVAVGAAATFNADFNAAGGMQNDASLTLFPAVAPPGRTISLGGAGLLNQNTLTLADSAPGTSGTLNVNGGTNAATGTFNVGAGWSVNVSTGTTLTSAGQINLLNSSGSQISGGTIVNNGGIQGRGTISSNVVNNSTIRSIFNAADPLNKLAFTGTVQNPSGSTITAKAGTLVQVSGGLGVNSGVISLEGGEFDNGGHDLTNNGIISGYGTLSNVNAVIDNNGTMTFVQDFTTINGKIINRPGHTVQMIQASSSLFNGAVTNNGGAFNVDSTATGTFAGGLANNAVGNGLQKEGSGMLTVAPTAGNTVSLADNSKIAVQGGTMIFNVSAGGGGAASGQGGGPGSSASQDVSVGSGVTAVVNAGAELMLVGSESNLSSGNNTVNITNDGTLEIGGVVNGVYLPGTNQSGGGVGSSSPGNPTGTLKVNQYSNGTFTHIVQDTLIVGQGGLVTIRATDEDGNPLTRAASSSALVIANSLAPSSSFGGSALGSPDAAANSDFADKVSAAGAPDFDGAVPPASIAVPEPHSLALLAFAAGILALTQTERRLRSMRRHAHLKRT